MPTSPVFFPTLPILLSSSPGMHPFLLTLSPLPLLSLLKGVLSLPSPLNTSDCWYSPFKPPCKVTVVQGNLSWLSPPPIICSLSVSLAFVIHAWISCCTVSIMSGRTVSVLCINVPPAWNIASSSQIFFEGVETLFGEVIWIGVIYSPWWGK